ncbi:MAG: hypothetical protein ACW99Q_00310 [Candidatus Kariarchaeaceae archaeon]
MGKLSITACALVSDIAKLKITDFNESIDRVSGITSFLEDVEESDHIITI